MTDIANTLWPLIQKAKLYMWLSGFFIGVGVAGMVSSIIYYRRINDTKNRD